MCVASRHKYSLLYLNMLSIICSEVLYMFVCLFTFSLSKINK